MPLGVLDHIAVAVKSIATARRFYEDVLGGQFMYELERPDKGYRLCKIELYRVAIELLEPLGADSFLHDYLAKRGEGLHHVAFNLPGSKWEAERLRQLGVTVIDDTDDAERHDAFISPRSSHRLLSRGRTTRGGSGVALAEEHSEAARGLIPEPPRRADGRGRPWREARAAAPAGILWALRSGAVPDHRAPPPRA